MPSKAIDEAVSVAELEDRFTIGPTTPAVEMREAKTSVRKPASSMLL